MAELKTKRNQASVQKYLKSVENEQRRKDCFELLEMMEEITGEKPEMWGSSIVGFGSYHYKYATGREGDWFLAGFAPRKQDLTIYMMAGFSRYEEMLAKLGKHKHGKACLYVKNLDDVDRKVLKRMITASVKHVAKNQGC